MEETSIYNIKELKEELINIELNEVINALKEKGYEPINQLAGYLLTDDLSYITSHNNARNIVAKYGKNIILKVILTKYMGKNL